VLLLNRGADGLGQFLGIDCLFHGNDLPFWGQKQLDALVLVLDDHFIKGLSPLVSFSAPTSLRRGVLRLDGSNHCFRSLSSAMFSSSARSAEEASSNPSRTATHKLAAAVIHGILQMQVAVSD